MGSLKSGTDPIKRPKYRDMVREAIGVLAERKGSSRQAIIKYIMGTYPLVDANRSKTFIRSALLEGVKTGELVQTKGSGASGSFKLGKTTTESKTKDIKAVRTKKATSNPKKQSKKESKNDEKKNPATKEKKVSVIKTKPASKNKSENKPLKTKKPPKVIPTKVVQEKPVKAVKAVKTFQSLSPSPMRTVSKIKTKILFSSTPSKNKKLSKLLTPKRIVVRPKKAVKKIKLVPPQS